MPRDNILSCEQSGVRRRVQLKCPLVYNANETLAGTKGKCNENQLKQTNSHAESRTSTGAGPRVVGAHATTVTSGSSTLALLADSAACGSSAAGFFHERIVSLAAAQLAQPPWMTKTLAKPRLRSCRATAGRKRWDGNRTERGTGAQNAERLPYDAAETSQTLLPPSSRRRRSLCSLRALAHPSRTGLAAGSALSLPPPLALSPAPLTGLGGARPLRVEDVQDLAGAGPPQVGDLHRRHLGLHLGHRAQLVGGAVQADVRQLQQLVCMSCLGGNGHPGKQLKPQRPLGHAQGRAESVAASAQRFVCVCCGVPLSGRSGTPLASLRATERMSTMTELESEARQSRALVGSTSPAP